jgi:hypothetical protein
MPVNDLAEEKPLLVERRRDRRSRSIVGARIVFRDGNCSMGCVILNLSDEGALVQPDDILLCPKTFVLQPRFDPPRNCQVIWRKGNKVGVRFV